MISPEVQPTWINMDQYGDQHAVNRHHITVSTSHKSHHSFRSFFSRPAGHGMDQFTQIRTMLSSFLEQKQETTHTAFCNYIASKAGQRNEAISPSNHSNRHFHEGQVQLQHLCHRHFNWHSNQHQLQPGHLTHLNLD